MINICTTYWSSIYYIIIRFSETFNKWKNRTSNILTWKFKYKVLLFVDVNISYKKFGSCFSHQHPMRLNAWRKKWLVIVGWQMVRRSFGGKCVRVLRVWQVDTDHWPAGHQWTLDTGNTHLTTGTTHLTPGTRVHCTAPVSDSYSHTHVVTVT